MSQINSRIGKDVSQSEFMQLIKADHPSIERMKSVNWPHCSPFRSNYDALWRRAFVSVNLSATNSPSLGGPLALKEARKSSQI